MAKANIQNVMYERREKNQLKENIKCLEDMSENLENIINKIIQEFDKINENKEALKINIQKIFKKLRNSINNREETLLKEIDEKFDDLFLKKNIIKESNKLQNKVKNSLEKKIN